MSTTENAPEVSSNERAEATLIEEKQGHEKALDCLATAEADLAVAREALEQLENIATSSLADEGNGPDMYAGFVQKVARQALSHLTLEGSVSRETRAD